jgi:hypothetical protein
MIKNKKVTFLFFQNGELWYTTECGFKFPVPITDVGTAAMNAEDKAILFMRWIRKEITVQEQLVADIEASKMGEKHNHLNNEL